MVLYKNPTLPRLRRPANAGKKRLRQSDPDAWVCGTDPSQDGAPAADQSAIRTTGGGIPPSTARVRYRDSPALA